MAERPVRLEFPSYNGATQARVESGVKCVVVLIELAADRSVARHGSIVLAPCEAKALGRTLIKQAVAAERPYG